MGPDPPVRSVGVTVAVLPLLFDVDAAESALHDWDTVVEVDDETLFRVEWT